jgi:L-lactate dehydrogenase complex protein LldG
MSEQQHIMRDVRRALGRSRAARGAAPVPPPIDEHIVRLVHSDIGLAELFARMARQNQMLVDFVGVSDIVDKLIESLRAQGCKRVALSADGLIPKLALVDALRSSGFVAQTWDQMALDGLYDVDCGVTDVRFAVAETGSLVIDGSREHARALSLVPPVHLAIVQPQNLLADLVDLFERLARDAQPRNTVIITGPSKTADIEMNLVTGVHGPGVVQVMLLDT